LEGEGEYKAEKGLIRVSLKATEGEIESIIISGDFFLYPEDKLWALEQSLLGCRLNRETLLNRIRDFYKKHWISSPGVKPEDFVTAILKASKSE